MSVDEKFGENFEKDLGLLVKNYVEGEQKANGK
jgi:hypothetical protein